MDMKKLLMIAIAAGTAFAATAPADARQGCGPGWHRGPYGHCRPNRGPGYGRPPAYVIGNYYPNRGYWDGRRFYHHRERWQGGWRYR
jgi:hypothetical protein